MFKVRHEVAVFGSILLLVGSAGCAAMKAELEADKPSSGTSAASEAGKVTSTGAGHNGPDGTGAHTTAPPVGGATGGAETTSDTTQGAGGLPIQEETVVISQVLPAPSGTSTRVISQASGGGEHSAPAGVEAVAHSHASGAKEDHGAHGSHWSYEGAGGPEHWGDMKSEYQLCRVGRNQSPIDLPPEQVIRAEQLQFHYPPIPLQVLNNGHTIQVNNSADAWIQLGEQRFDLLQFHFHSPGEHTVQGRSFPLEMHLVHRSPAGALAVVGVLFEPGQENPVLQAIWSHIPAQLNVVGAPPNLVLDLQSMVPQTGGFVRYAGSLTTPPCTEGIEWVVLQQTNFVSVTQINALLSVMPNNARPTQFLLGRKVYRSP